MFFKAPAQLALLAVSFGLVITAAALLTLVNPALGSLIQLLTMLATPVLMGGLIWAVREVSQGRQARAEHLFEGFRHGRLPHLLVAVLPYFIASMVLGAMLYLLIGTDGLQRWQQVQAQINEITAAGGTLDPAQVQAMAESLPVFRFLLWIIITALTNVAICLMLAFMLPQVMFSGIGGWAALINSLRTSLVNLPAMAVFYLMALVAMFILYFATAIIMLVVGGLITPQIGLLLALVFFMGTALPILAGAVYLGWQQMFAHADAPGTTPPPVPGPRNVFEA